VCDHPDVGAPRLLGHNFDAYVPGFDHDEDAPSVIAQTEEILPMGKGLEDIEISLQNDHPASDELCSVEQEGTAKDQVHQGGVEHASDELCNAEQGGAVEEHAVEPQMHHADEMSGVGSGSLAQSGEGIEDMQAPEQEQEVEHSDMNSTVETAPDCLVNEDERYDAALDNTTVFEPVEEVIPEIASTEDAQQPEPAIELAIELGADARSQAVTVTEMSMEQQGKVFLVYRDSLKGLLATG
jgi:hypothetical protein